MSLQKHKRFFLPYFCKKKRINMGAAEFIKNEKGELKTDCYYDFKILKKNLAPDGHLYYILEDPFGHKHMMESECYADYNLVIGNSVSVVIDKINCKGQVFFEPKHPHFSSGEIFDCPYMGQITKLNKYNQNQTYLEVMGPDSKPNLVETVSKHQEKEGYSTQFITCKIRKIRKGRLVLTQFLG